MPFLKIRRLWKDQDQVVQFEVVASNDSQLAQQNFYGYAEQLVSFGKRLQEFGRSPRDEVRFEYGEDPNFYSYLLLRAIVLDSVGHSAIEIKTDNRLDPPDKTENHFYMKCEIATINDLGAELCSWALDMTTDFNKEWRIA